MIWEVHYCNPIEYCLHEIPSEEYMINAKENKVYSTFTEAKKALLNELRKDKQTIQDAIDKTRRLKKSDW